MESDTRFKIVVFAIMGLISLMIFSPVFATHLWTGHKWTRVNTLIYYCLQPTMPSWMKSAVNTAASHINGWVGQFTLREKIWDSACVNHISVGNVGSTCPNCIIALYKMYYYTTASNSNIKSADIIISDKSKFDNLACDPNITPETAHYNLVYTMHHEFAHWLEGRHTTFSTEVSVLSHQYSCTNWNNFKSHDISSFNTIYPTTTSTSSLRAMEAGDTDEDAIKAGAKKGPHHFGVDRGIKSALHEDKDKRVQHDDQDRELSDSQQKTYDKIMKQRERNR